jgi:hypothetical protein
MTLDRISEIYSLDIGEPVVEIPNVTRDDMAVLFQKLGFKSGVEIGVLGGEYSEVLLKANPELELIGVDPWTAYHTYHDWVRQSRLSHHRGVAMERLKGLNVSFMEQFSLDAVKEFPDNSLDFVYIDGNHELPYVMNDIIEWNKKVKPDGIVSGHDYYKSPLKETTNHSQYAVDAFTQAYHIKLFLVGRKNAPEGEKRDQQRSWFFVKE